MYDSMFENAERTSAAQILKEHGEQLRDAFDGKTALLKNELLALNPGWEQRILAHFQEAYALSQAQRKLGEALAVLSAPWEPPAVPAPSSAPDEGTLRYLVSSRSLAEWHGYLTGDPQERERMAMLTGPVTPDGLRVLACMEVVPMEKQSAGFVKAVNGAAGKLLNDLHERSGHAMHAMAHSHISYGAASTEPSATDLENQLRFSKIGWEAIGCIMSLDGYVRFFDPARDFTIEVYGKDAELIEDKPCSKVFRLSGIRNGQDAALAARSVGG